VLFRTLIVTGLGLGIAKKLERGLHFEVWAHLVRGGLVYGRF